MKSKRFRKPSQGLCTTKIKHPSKQRSRKQRSRKQSSSLGSNANTHEAISNEDIMINILNRLPTEALAKLMLVSKSFRNMITEWTPLPRPPHLIGFFVKNTWGKFDSETRWASYTHHLMLSARAKCAEFLHHESLHVVASSKGILLCTASSIQPRVYYLFNPITSQEVTLPSMRNDAPKCWGVKVGFDCQIIDGVIHYMVLLIDDGFIRVFSSKEGRRKWKKINFKLNDKDYLVSLSVCCTRLGIAVGGVFYWQRYLAYEKEHDIIACDPSGREGNRFWKVELPETLLLGRKHQCWLGGVRNSHLYFGATMDGGKEVRVWVCKEESNRTDIGVKQYKWKLEHTLRLDKLLEDHPGAFELLEEEAHELAQFNYAKFVFKGFHPCIEGIMLFSFEDKFMSYTFKDEKLEVHFSTNLHFPDNLHQSYEQRLSYIPFEWMPSGYLEEVKQERKRKKN